ncbi:MAG: NAD(P)/FAD-dependent oxidoreductase [Leptolyngbyaceae cyanobacterium bins.302]|nr:NAD(P)/FAD-dependent oxidoreductase [Leptolyngbyaceae cyanobacterium bins.302]
MTLTIVVIGGGAAGFFGAIASAEAHPQARVLLLEAARQPLAKVRISGGGRCNVTQACFDPALLVQNYPRGGKALRGAFSRFQAKDTVAWFRAHGVELKTEPDGRMFPVTDDSATIVQCLMQSASEAGVQVRTGGLVQTIAKQASRFVIQLKSGQEIRCDRVLLATGSSPRGYAIAQALGHHLTPPVPSLFTFNVPDSRLAGLAGVAVNSVHLRLQGGEKAAFEQTGPLLITHWGVSGPAVLKLSAWGARALHEQRYQATLRVNWVPQSNPEALRQQLQAVRSQLSRKTIVANCPVMIPRRLWEKLTAHVGVQEGDRWAEISNKTLNLLIQELTQGQYQITGKGVFKEEFVTCGGVELKEIDFKTMQSKVCPGLYLAGEILDIDGITGGFNFQSAWTTGWLAGRAMAVEG